MDLAAEAERLRLDMLAVELSSALERGGVPHVLLKGPSTANWLYSPPRRYRDVDLLVPGSRAADAATVLARSGLATSRSGGIGEEASHAWLLHSTEGYEVDLHVSLPSLPTHGDNVWRALQPHVVLIDLDVGSVPALDQVGRCLVIALHAINGGPDQAAEDLRRARAETNETTWTAVKDLASTLDASDLVSAGLARVEGVTTPLSRRARLYLSEAPEAALGLERLRSATPAELPRLVWRELFPSRGFMAYYTGELGLRRWALARAHVRRWRRLSRQLPQAVRYLRSRG
jgi:Uncharacterised nucleotidyltransferase